MRDAGAGMILPRDAGQGSRVPEFPQNGTGNIQLTSPMGQRHSGGRALPAQISRADPQRARRKPVSGSLTTPTPGPVEAQVGDGVRATDNVSSRAEQKAKVRAEIVVASKINDA